MAVLFIVTASTTCSMCNFAQTFSGEIDAESSEDAMETFRQRHAYCLGCYLFGIHSCLSFERQTAMQNHRAGRRD